MKWQSGALLFFTTATLLLIFASLVLTEQMIQLVRGTAGGGGQGTGVQETGGGEQYVGYNAEQVEQGPEYYHQPAAAAEPDFLLSSQHLLIR